MKKHEGEAYREELQEMVRRFGLEDHVVMLDRYLEEDELAGLITACDLYITPYPGMQQITSGTLAYAVGLGRPVLSTPYSYARDLLRAQELLIPYHDIENWAQKMSELLSDSRKRKKWEHHIRDIGRSMHWPEVGRLHARLFEEISGLPCGSGGRTLKKPPVSFRHLARMTDDTGLLEHSLGKIPRRNEGYTTDDNARALWVAAEWLDLKEEASLTAEQAEELDRLADIYLAFLLWAQKEDGGFHNNFDYNRTPEPETSSDDCLGRTLWACASAIVRMDDDLQVWPAVHMWNRALVHARGMKHPGMASCCRPAVC